MTKMTADNNYGISNSKIELSMNDGSKLTIASPSTATTVRLADGSEYVAVNRGSTKEWTVA